MTIRLAPNIADDPSTMSDNDFCCPSCHGLFLGLTTDLQLGSAR
jgi:hypothetical protein